MAAIVPEEKDNFEEVANGSGSDSVFRNGREEDVVISGMAGRFPESDTVEELKKNLFDGIDVVTLDGDRWPAGMLGIPPRSGKLKNVAAFDAPFFGFAGKQAHNLDPQIRILLEVSYEAIIDAGVNPYSLSGTNTGVFVGCIINETEIYRMHDPNKVEKSTLIGFSRSLLANYISFAFDLKGPSYMLDAACASSIFCLHQALLAMKAGECDSALVAACNLILRPNSTIGLQKLGVISPRAICNSFDAAADGYVRSEAVVAVYLQKASSANRIYSTILNAKVNIDGTKLRGIAFPSRTSQMKLVEKVYAGANVRISDVVFVECHATGTKVGDTEEVNALTEVFCKHRTSPLPITSTRTNIGHTESAAGLCSLVKVLLSMESGYIPPCLHYVNPSTKISGLHDGRLQVIDKTTPLNGKYVSINSFGIGGTNAHILLQKNLKEKMSTVQDNVPRLVCVSGRTEAAVEFMLDKIISQPRDNEFYALIHQIHKCNIPRHNYRGFAVLGERVWKKIMPVVEEQRPIWFAFSGIGSEWAGMARDLMQFELFRNLTKNVANILKSVDLDLYTIFTATDECVTDNVLNSIVSITAMQVILVDILKSMGIKPEGIIGHSLGEIACAYADDAFTQEEAILTSYWRGRCLLDSQLPERAMAVVGLSWSDCAERAPPDIQIACHNYVDLVSISGPCESIDKFVEELVKENIFSRRLPSAGFAFHSKYVAEIGPVYLEKLKKIIINPKSRTSRWISSSIPQDEWNSPLAQCSSAAYHVNNFLNPVLFYEALKMVPKNALVMEIGPHALLLSVIKKALGPESVTIGLLDRRQPNNAEFLLKSIGKLFCGGGQPDISKIFPPVDFPVSRGTPMIQSLIKWDHSVNYDVSYFSDPSGCFMNENTIVEINPANEKHSFYFQHYIDGKIMFPASGYVAVIWQMIAKFEGRPMNQLPIVIENMRILRSIILRRDEVLTFSVTILRGSGSFEICESGAVVAVGSVNTPKIINDQFLQLPELETAANYFLSDSEIYSEFEICGHSYTGAFRGIKSSDNTGIHGELYFKENFVTFIDTMIQFVCLAKMKRELHLPTQMRRIVIDPCEHTKLAQSTSVFGVSYHKDIDVIRSGGVEITGLQTTIMVRHQTQNEVLSIKKCIFVPFESDRELDDLKMEQALAAVIGIVLENNYGFENSKIRILHKSDAISDLLVSNLTLILSPKVNLGIVYMSTSESTRQCGQTKASMCPTNIESFVDSDCTLIVLANGTRNVNEFKTLVDRISDGGFILCFEEAVIEVNLESFRLNRIAKLVVDNKFIYLFKKMITWSMPENVIIARDYSYDWVDEISDVKTLILSREPNSSISAVIKERKSKNLRSLFILDPEFKNCSLKSPIIREQLKKDLIQNVFKNSVWGSYQYVPIEATPELRFSQHACVKTAIPGDVSSACWVELPPSLLKRERCQKKSKLCHVYYATLNSRDVSTAMQRNKILGNEFSGRDLEGKRVMGIVDGCVATSVLSDNDFLWEIPEKWTLSEAASVPSAYAAAYYGLFTRGGLQAGESILIHNGALDVCQAAIAIASHAACTVYATLSNVNVEAYLKKKFPKLITINVANIRDSVLEQLIVKRTDGNGFNVILSSKMADKLDIIMRCLRKNGRFLQFDDFVGNTNHISLDNLADATFHAISFDFLMGLSADDSVKQSIAKIMDEGIRSGAVIPLGNTVFDEDDLERALRNVSKFNEIPKVTIKIRDEEPLDILEPVTKCIKILASSPLLPHKTYIVIGTFDEVGVELVHWLISEGAKQILFATHDTISSAYQSFHVQQWENSLVNVYFTNHDCSTKFGANSLLKKADSIGPVAGIFFLIPNNNLPNLHQSITTIIKSVENLDVTSRTNCTSLDYFVIFTAVEDGVIDSIANKVMCAGVEKICDIRNDAGFPSVYIRWENLENNSSYTWHSYLACLNELLKRSNSIFTVSMNKGTSDVLEKQNNGPKFLDMLVDLFGIKISANLMERKLTEIGLDSLRYIEFQQILCQKFDITLTAGEIQEITASKIVKLLNNVCEPKV